MNPRNNQSAILLPAFFLTMLTHSHAEGQSGIMDIELISEVNRHNQPQFPYLSLGTVDTTMGNNNELLPEYQAVLAQRSPNKKGQS